MSYYKFTARDYCHNGLRFREGVNKAREPWSIRECGPGGIYLAKRDTFWKWITYRELYWVWDAEIDDGSPWQEEPGDKVKAHRVVLSNPRPISSLFTTEAIRLAAVSYDGQAIQYISEPSTAVQLAAVCSDGPAIIYIREPSEAVQLAAVRQNGWAIQYIREPSEELQLAAVGQTGWAIQYIQNPSEAVKAASLKQRP